MAQHTGFGTSFSPIPVEQTEEELQAFLARMFGPGGGGVGVGRLPTPQVRGVPPNEILRAFLASRAGGGVSPDIAQFVLAPQRPSVAGAPTPTPTLGGEQFTEDRGIPLQPPPPLPPPISPELEILPGFGPGVQEEAIRFSEQVAGLGGGGTPFADVPEEEEPLTPEQEEFLQNLGGIQPRLTQW